MTEVARQLEDLSPERRALLAQRLRQRQAAKPVPSIPALARVGEHPAFELSFAQQRLWFLSQWQPESAAYHIPATFSIAGEINVSVLQTCLDKIIQRHEVLRSTIEVLNDEPMQVIQPFRSLDLELVDLRGLSNEQQASQRQQQIERHSQQPFDLSKDLMLRGLLLHTADDHAELVLTIHHIACDGWSIGVLLRELGQLYEAGLHGEQLELPALPIQYADFAVWHKRYVVEEVYQQHLNFWQAQLSGPLPLLNLPTDHARPAVKRDLGATVEYHLPWSLVEAVERLSRQERATPFMLFMAAFQVLLYRYSGQSDLIIGTPIANRTRREIENLIGFFVNTLPIRVNLAGSPSFRSLIAQVRQTSLAAFEHQDMPLEHLIDVLKVERSLSHNPLFQALFVHQTTSIQTVDSGEFGLQFGGAIETGSAKFDINLNLAANRATFEYNTDLFKRSTIERMASHFHSLLEYAVTNPDACIEHLPLLSSSERQQLLQTWNSTNANYPAVDSIVSLFEAQAARVPERTALHFEGQSLSYAELNQRANQLAHSLHQRGIGCDMRVGLFIDRSLDLLVGALGILKAGAAYVPIDPIYPQDRISAMLEDGAVSLLITHAELAADLPALDLEVLCLDEAWPTIAQAPTQNLNLALEPRSLMYVLFTSGSTGRPKGVAIEHRNYVNYIQGLLQRIAAEDGWSYALVSTFAADLGTTNVYGALCSGGELHIVAYERATDPEAFAAYFRQHRIDVMKLVPSHFEAMRGLNNLADVIPKQRLILAGEASLWEQLADIRQLQPSVQLQNHYGPTETTVSMLTYPIPSQPRYPSSTVPLGRPLGNVQIYVLDRQLQPTPQGVPGELYVGGAGVGRGYIGRPDLTAERFVPNPFSAEAGSRLYRSGDLVRYQPDGAIEFLGRIDLQVKIRGYRVELSEIETAIQSQAQVANSVVILREDTPGDKRLVAYIVPEAGQSLNIGSIREALRNSLPDYMVPTAFVELAGLPLNPNGKIERRALPAPSNERNLDSYVAPQTATEHELAGIWAEVLGLDQVGIDDNFFDLGGESFKAIRVVRKIGSHVSVMTLFKYPTVRELAAHLSGASSTESGGMLYELTKAQAKHHTTIVAIPYGGGSAITYQPLAQAMPKGYRLLAAELPGHDFSRPDEPLQALEVVASQLASEIQAKTQGPIVLYGHCVGSAMTVEIGRLLEQAGRDVQGIVLGGNFPAARVPGRFFEWLNKLMPADRWMSDRTYRDFLRALGGFTEIVDPAEQTFVMRSLRHDAREVERYFTQAFAQKQPQQLKAPIACIIGEMDRATEYYQERYREWEYFSNNVTLHVIPHAGHYFLKHQASELGQIIDQQTEQWQQPRPIQPTAAKSKSHKTSMPSLRIFFMVALGQLVSMLGSSLSSFALGIWIYQRTGTVSDFAFTAIASMLPSLLVSPLAGAIADRWDRRWIMIIADTISALSTIVIAMLLWANKLEVWHIYLTAAVSSIAGTFQRPAYAAAMTQLVPKQYLGHANGVIQLGSATGGLIAPFIAGGMVAFFGLGGVFLLDFISFSLGIGVLFLVRFPNTLYHKREEPLLREIVRGWEYIIKRPSLVAMVLFFALGNIWFGIASISMSPLVLSFGGPAELGIVSAACALGGFLGGLFMSLWGGLQRRAEGMVGFVILEGFFIALAGLRPSVWLVALAMFGMWFAISLVNAHWQVLIQTKVGLELQGRVQATNQMLAMLSIPLGYWLAGPLADKLFGPLLEPNGALSSSLGWLFGVGPDRGIGLLMVVVGLGAAIWALIGFNYRPLRYMEDALPDAIPDAEIASDRDTIQAQADGIIATTVKG
ncbi:non-ribosomal peptide synthetase/MFS transporter [Herpetosiphon geysericola]|uniref:Carrier domain-containing protein n=1 Tax=Herpetosiphon geysericola TaxID=70996 RepID=A0A0P6XZY2_9CHLR|nr:non-ribosomal peptide synthetase/MFS transporter [Herpetosiphon geysericola]KPL90596.1 hypothetical protein SE18_05850 [Herpetosiphon geysericola]